MAEGYRIRVATLQDRALLDDWRRQPHVQEWWGPPEPFTEEDFAEPGVVLSIVECDGVPFAFIQDYDVHAWPNHHFGYLPAGSRGIDQFIGPPGCWGRGTAAGSSASGRTSCLPPARRWLPPIRIRRMPAPSRPAARPASGSWGRRRRPRGGG